MKKVLVIGGGVAGTEAVITLRKYGFTVELLSDRPYFYAYPAAIWVPTGEVKPEAVKLGLEDFCKRWGASFRQGKLERIEEDKAVLDDGTALSFDYAVLALGQGKLPVKGLEHTLSPCGTPEEIERIKDELDELIKKGTGRIAFGFAGNPKDKSAMRGGPLFELLFNVDDLLRRRGLRERFELFFFSPSPSPGERLGKKAVELLQKTFKKLGIKSKTGVKIKEFTPEGVVFEDGETVKTDLTLFIPGGKGLPVLERSGLPLNEAGFVKIDDRCRVEGSGTLYAVGDCAAVEGPPWVAKQGHLSESMARIAARDLAYREGLTPKPPESYKKHLHIICLMDMGRRGAGLAYRDDRRALFIPLPVVGHWIKRLWLPYYKAVKTGRLPRII
ncbi:MAG: FAD-dependent oxidoreductase [Aquificae bacterium]|nr:FAD-dependent oxidoreductase [Aquificota bacterium]